VFQTARQDTHQRFVSLSRRNCVLLPWFALQAQAAHRKVHRHALYVPSLVFPLFRLASFCISFHKSSPKSTPSLSYIRFLHTFALVHFDLFQAFNTPLLIPYQLRTPAPQTCLFPMDASPSPWAQSQALTTRLVNR
jgi:hypothetical protein